jgi:hypothetical protein
VTGSSSGFEVNETRAQTEAELLRVWSRLEPYATWNSSQSSPPGIVTPEDRNVLELWLNLFAEEIDLVRRARNTVSHALAAPDEQIEGTLEVGKKLWDLLQDRLQEVRQPRVTQWLFQLHRSGRPWDKRADEVDWAATAVGNPVQFEAVQFGHGAWYARGPVAVVAAEDLDDPAWTVSRSQGGIPLMTGRVDHALVKGQTFALPVTDGIVGGVAWP